MDISYLVKNDHLEGNGNPDVQSSKWFKVGRSAHPEGLIDQTRQFKSFSEYSRKSMQLTEQIFNESTTVSQRIFHASVC